MGKGNAKTGRKWTRRTEDWRAAAKGSEKEGRRTTQEVLTVDLSPFPFFLPFFVHFSIFIYLSPRKHRVCYLQSHPSCFSHPWKSPSCPSTDSIAPFPSVDYYTSQMASSDLEAATALKVQGNKAFAEHEWPTAVDFYTQAIEKYDREPSFFSNRAQVRLGRVGSLH